MLHDYEIEKAVEYGIKAVESNKMVVKWARDVEEFGKKHHRHELPIEQKESNKWLKSFQAAQKAQQQCPDTVIVSVGDQESDIYELFDLALRDPKNPKLLIRAEHDRLLSDDQRHLWEFVKSQPLRGIRELHIPRRGKRAGRNAKLEIRFCKVTLKAPNRKQHLKELSVSAILAEEIDYAEGTEPLQWMLITTFDKTRTPDARCALYGFLLPKASLREKTPNGKRLLLIRLKIQFLQQSRLLCVKQFLWLPPPKGEARRASVSEGF